MIAKELREKNITVLLNDIAFHNSGQNVLDQLKDTLNEHNFCLKYYFKCFISGGVWENEEIKSARFQVKKNFKLSFSVQCP